MTNQPHWCLSVKNPAFISVHCRHYCQLVIACFIILANLGQRVNVLRSVCLFVGKITRKVLKQFSETLTYYGLLHGNKTLIRR